MAVPHSSYGAGSAISNGHLSFDIQPQAQGRSSSLAQDRSSSQPQTKDPAIHQRTYQACIPCRRRKVRCDLGSVDSPHDPPCLRCRREAKECFFSATRRKKKGAEEDDSVSIEPQELDQPGRKRLRASTVEDDDEEIEYEERPRTPGGSIGRLQPLRRPDSNTKQQPYGDEDIKVSDQTTAILQASEVHSGHDALKVLYEAAQRVRPRSMSSTTRPNFNGPSPSSLPPATSPIVEKIGSSGVTSAPMGAYQSDPSWKTRIGSMTSKDGTVDSLPQDPAAYAATLKAWSRFRFVRAGWFTAKEAVAYIDYFYKYLSPLTPVALPDFRPYDSHVRLLTQEPMLTITILLVASRHMNLEGPGSKSRPYEIHHKLWTYLQGMVNRVVWGQEQMGGGFCGAGAEPAADVNPLSRKGLRTLGTVESLILITEWHPRAMHFPPDEQDDDLMMPEVFLPVDDDSTEDPANKGIGGQRMDSWLEPCWRSDRLCWMLLGMAMSLAFEIGVFDKSEWQRHAVSTSGQPLSAEGLTAYDKRRGNVRDLLLVYVTLTSGRLGLTSMLPSNYSKPEDSDLYKRALGQHDSVQQTVMHFWLRLAATLRDGNQRIFANKAFTRDLIKNGNYKDALEQAQRPFIQWHADFERCAIIPKYMRYILEIEYDYCRVYLNALALQAVAERCANEYPIQIVGQAPDFVRSAVTTNGMRTDTAITPQTLAKWLGGDRKYMIEVRDAACHLLKVVVDGLYPGQYLKHTPVRTYFRIVSVAIMLLKSFSLGASEADVADSLKLVDRTVEAIRTCIVDDVHVASRFADLLDTLIQNLKPRLVRISADGRSAGHTRRPSQHSTPVHPTSQFATNGNGHGHSMSTTQQASTGAYAPQQHQQQQWTYSPGPANAATNPLFGISNDAYDYSDNNFSIMPPPSFGLHSPTGSNQNNTNNLSANLMPPSSNTGYNFGGYGNGDDMGDWLALPLDPLLNMSGDTYVTQTMYGPEVGGQDMLELLLGAPGTQGPQGGNGY
ncbi:hypothetical protein B0A48_01055 [Cryoendolithus antarcticus]|uniref:Zn(2)-C6 fungal-type domain-containing protein n=1 Tax=Cryoendolithus antarcticus TaxID=1507870 RepID=A0A1V8TS59_9PEZI|nr:hypothetical protein B0A48_01055 [Cryoendolithus antarcticus]